MHHAGGGVTKHEVVDGVWGDDEMDPNVVQVYVGVREDLDLSALERLLFQARRRAEIALSDLPDFYVVSLSAHVFAYKGMVMPEHLPAFFKDLARPELITSGIESMYAVAIPVTALVTPGPEVTSATPTLVLDREYPSAA